MALAQTASIVERLGAVVPDIVVETVRFKPAGDRDQITKLDRHGGKGGAFVAEIRDAIRAGQLQAAMHSLKDVPGDEEAPGLVLGSYLARDNANDALVLRPDHTIHAFENARGSGYKIGTNSVRRAAYLKRLYPECEIIHFRGAGDTRLKKLDEQILQQLPDGGSVGPVDALVMAASGLARIDAGNRISKLFCVDEMLPAIGQGIIVVECAREDFQTREVLAEIDNADARCCALAEREVLWVLNGHCNSPIAGNAQIDGDQLRLRASVLSLDGGTILEAVGESDAARPRELGRKVGLALLHKGADQLIEAHGNL